MRPDRLPRRRLPHTGPVDDRPELIVQALSVFNDGGADGFLDFLSERDALDPGFVMELQRDAPNGGVWKGADGFREMARIWLEAWEVFELHPQDPEELDPDRFLVPTRQRAVARGTGIELDELFFYTVEFADERFKWIGLYTERSLAEEALRER